jgi:hypothetical protein
MRGRVQRRPRRTRVPIVGGRGTMLVQTRGRTRRGYRGDGVRGAGAVRGKSTRKQSAA